MLSSEQTDQLWPALVAFHAAAPNVERGKTAIVKTKAGGEYRYTYASLDRVMDAIRGPLSDSRLAISHATSHDSEAGRLNLETRVVHESGQWIGLVMPVIVTETGPQALGSALTYARRYAISCLLNIATEEDDDAQAGGGKGEAKAKGERKRPPKEDPPAETPQDKYRKRILACANANELVTLAQKCRDYEPLKKNAQLLAWVLDAIGAEATARFDASRITQADADRVWAEVREPVAYSATEPNTPAAEKPVNTGPDGDHSATEPNTSETPAAPSIEAWQRKIAMKPDAAALLEFAKNCSQHAPLRADPSLLVQVLAAVEHEAKARANDKLISAAESQMVSQFCVGQLRGLHEQAGGTL